MKYIASCSYGKDSLAMILKIIELGLPLDFVVFFDTGMEFGAIYKMKAKLDPIVEQYGAKSVVLKPEVSFLEKMLLTPISKRDGNIQYGYDWCGGRCRWATGEKVKAIQKFLNSLNDEYKQYIGIAYDEPDRIKYENNKVYPLYDLKMTEKDCINYCYENGFDWEEDGIRLYDVLDRVSCYCCTNKNLKELRAIFHDLPKYWNKLKAMQSRIDRPFRQNATIFDLEQRFLYEDSQAKQMTIFDL